MSFDKAPHPGWIPILRLVFGFIFAMCIVVLATCIAVGKVEKDSSFGLLETIRMLNDLTIIFVLVKSTQEK